MEIDKILDFCKEKTPGLKVKEAMPIQEITECSLEVSKKCGNYTHNLYQCVVAAIAVSQDATARVLEMPTGSGKTWVYAIMALY